MTDEPLDDPQLLELFEAASAGRLSAEQIPEFERRLSDDPELCRQFLRYCRMHVDLWFTMRAQRADARLLQQIASEAPIRAAAAPVALLRQAAVYLAHPLRFSLLAATVTLVSIMLTMAQVPVDSPAAPAPAAGGASAEPIVLARLERQHQAVWADRTPLRAGAPIRQRRLQLVSGLAQLRFAGGGRVVVEGPAVLRVASAQAVHLESGKLTALVPPRARGFTVHTRQFEIVDLGTEFGVSAHEAGAEVHVFQGVVEVRRRAAVTAAPLRVQAGGSAHLDPVRGIELTAAPGLADIFVRSLPAERSALPEVTGETEGEEGVLLSESFSSRVLDPSRWRIAPRASVPARRVVLEGGVAKLINRGTLITAESFDARVDQGYRVLGRWTTAAPGGRDALEIVLRSSGALDAQRGFALDGVTLYAWFEEGEPQPLQIRPRDASWSLSDQRATGVLSAAGPGATFFFEVRDEGSHLSFTVTQEDQPANSATLRAAISGGKPAGHLIISNVYNQQSGGKPLQEAWLHELRIERLRPEQDAH